MAIATVIGALMPMVLTMLLGYFAGWHKDFKWDQALILNRMVLLYALPLMIFSGMVQASREQLFAMGPVALALIASLVVFYVVPLLVIRYVFHRGLAESALQAFVIGAPGVPIVGPAVLGYLFSPSISASLITISNFTLNLVALPLCVILCSIASGKEKATRATFTSHILLTLKEPVVWIPFVAILIVLCGVPVSPAIRSSMTLLGQATSGVALFAAGIVLFSSKLKFNVAVAVSVVGRAIAVPLLCWAAFAAVHLPAVAIREAVLTMGLPAGPVGIILAVQFQKAESEIASATFFGVVLSVVTMGVLIWLLP